MWDRFVFIVEHLKTITFFVVVLFAMVLISLQLAGRIDIEADCPFCARLIPTLISSAAAADTPSARDLLLFRVRISDDAEPLVVFRVAEAESR